MTKELIILLLAAASLAGAADSRPVPPVSVQSMAVAANGAIFIAGAVASQLFEATPGAVQPTYRAATCTVLVWHGPPGSIACPDLYVLRLDPTGQKLEAATYLGSNGPDSLLQLSVLPDGAVTVVASVSGEGFPGQPEGRGGQAITRLSANLDRVEWSYYLPNGVWLPAYSPGSDGSVVLAGSVCAVQFRDCTPRLLRLGPTGTVAWDRANVPAGWQDIFAISQDIRSGKLWIAGRSGTGGFQLGSMNLADGSDARGVAPLNDLRQVYNLGVDAAGDPVLTGQAADSVVIRRYAASGEPGPSFSSGLIPRQFFTDPGSGLAVVSSSARLDASTTRKALYRCPGSQFPQNVLPEPYLMGWDPRSGKLQWATYLPVEFGPGLVAVLPEGRVLSVLNVADSSPRFSILTPAAWPDQPPCASWPPVNAANHSRSVSAALAGFYGTDLDVVAPGQFLAIHGSGLAPGDPGGPEVAVEMDGTRTSAPRELSGTRVLFNGTPAAMISAGRDRVVAQVPYAVAGMENVRIEVEVNGQLLAPQTMRVVPSSPLIFGPEPARGSVWNADWKPNTEANPAKPGDVVQLFVSGAGILGGIGDDALAVGSPAPELTSEVIAFIQGSGGQPVEFAGGVPGQLPGLVQVNVRIVDDFIFHGRMTLELQINGRPAVADLWVK